MRAKVSQNGRVTIPAEWRHQLGWKSGDLLLGRIEEGGFIIRKLDGGEEEFARLQRVRAVVNTASGIDRDEWASIKAEVEKRLKTSSEPDS